MQNIQRRIAAKDVIVHENIVRANRLMEKSRMNIETSLRTMLRAKGAVQIKIEGFETDDVTAKVKASYILGNEHKIGEFVFGKDKLKNWVPKNFESSMDVAELVLKPQIEAKENEVVEVVEFDLSLIKAIQHGNAFRIEYPLIGNIGELTKSEITESNIKMLCALVTAEMGVEPKFVGKYNVQFLEDSYLVDGPSAPEIQSKNESMQAKVQIGAMQKVQYEDQFAGMRENFDKVIKINASELIKRKVFSYKTGVPKIVDTKTFIEMKDGSYSGNVIVKAQVKDDLLTFALPVIGGKLKIKADIMKYKIEESEFKNIVRAEMEERLKAKLEEDLSDVVASEQYQRLEVANAVKRLKATRVGEIQKQIHLAKVNYEDLKPGMILNLSSGKYRVNEGDNPANWTLTLIDEAVAV